MASVVSTYVREAKMRKQPDSVTQIPKQESRDQVEVYSSSSDCVFTTHWNKVVTMNKSDGYLFQA